MSVLVSGQPYAKMRIPQAPAGEKDVSGLSKWARSVAAYLSTDSGNTQRALAPSALRSITSAYTAMGTDGVIVADATVAPFTVTLPSADTVDGAVVTIKKVDASANAVTVGGTVDGVVNPTLATQWKSMTVYSDSTQWLKLASV